MEVSLLDQLRRAESLALLLDYDGTLVPFAATPDEAVPGEKLCALLRALAARERTHVHVVSGRDRHSLGHWLGALPISMHAEHGYWTRRSGDADWAARFEVDAENMGLAFAAVLRLTEAVGGGVERKHAGVAWHYRGWTIDAETVANVRAQLALVVGGMGYEVLEGDCVLEVRRRGVHKGLVLERVRDWHGSAVTLAAFGDDHTDEDLFRALPHGSITVKVGSHESVAAHRMPDHSSVRALLADLL
jgi:trehalose 6-phosphate synthase/phosphatase